MSIIDPKKEIDETKRAIKEKMLTLVVAAFTLVAALAWNDAVQSLVKVISRGNEGLMGKFIYAVMVTAIAAIISLQFSRLSKKERKNQTGKNSDDRSA